MSRLVEIQDQAPLVLKRSEMKSEVVAVCRCGLSAAWPYCDGSHQKTRDEVPGKLVVYTRAAGSEPKQLPEPSARTGPGDPGTSSAVSPRPRTGADVKGTFRPATQGP